MSGTIYLDTETTGLDDNAEIIEIAIIDDEGKSLINTKVQCQGEISPAAITVHGITKADLADAPLWADVYHQVINIINAAGVLVIYNLSFDWGMLIQTSERYCLDFAQDVKDELKCECCMIDFKQAHDLYSYEKLGYAYLASGGKKYDVQAHAALGDCMMTRHVWLTLKKKEKIKEKREEYRLTARAKKMALIPKDGHSDKYPYFGQVNRPEGYKTLSQLTMSELDKYEYAGQCCSYFGDPGYLFRPIKPIK